jgi:hypothetical protein
VEKFIGADRRITVDSVSTALGCYRGLAYRIMHNRLKFRKACTRWLPKELKDGEKSNRLGLSLQHFLRYADGGEDMLNRIVTWDESRVHRY